MQPSIVAFFSLSKNKKTEPPPYKNYLTMLSKEINRSRQTYVLFPIISEYGDLILVQANIAGFLTIN